MTKWRVLEPRGFASAPGGGTQRIYVPRPDLARDTATGCWRAVIDHVGNVCCADRRGIDQPRDVWTFAPWKIATGFLRHRGWVVERMPKGGT